MTMIWDKTMLPTMGPGLWIHLGEFQKFYPFFWNDTWQIINYVNWSIYVDTWEKDKGTFYRPNVLEELKLEKKLIC